MKFLYSFLIITALTASAHARGPYFENSSKAPIAHGVIIFNSPELQSLGKGEFIGDVVIKKNNQSRYEVGPMIYKCTFNDDDGAYGSLGCRYSRYLDKKALSYDSCEINEIDESFSCYQSFLRMSHLFGDN